MLEISWKDCPEKYDDSQKMRNTLIEPLLSPDFKNHILIEGDNYPVLYNLQPFFQEKINIIYIDPPYNTGNAFTYNDDFSNNEGRHDSWLSFMNRRLILARDLLAKTGVIFIAIDQSELYVLKLLCDRIFGEENFVNDFMWLHGKGKKDTWSRTLQQHTLCYARDKKHLKPFEEFQETQWATKNIDNDPRGNWFSGSISFSESRSNPNHKNYFTITSPGGKKWTRQWQVSQSEMENLIKEDKIFWGYAPEYKSVPRKKIFNNEKTKVIPRNIIDCVESTRSAQKHLDELLGEKGVFDNPKPVDLIAHLLEITNMGKDSLVLDFFAGSGTTFEAVCELNARDGGNRRCILVQKDEVCNTFSKSEKSFSSIFDICRCRCEKVGKLYNEEVGAYKLVEPHTPDC